MAKSRVQQDAPAKTVRDTAARTADIIEEAVPEILHDPLLRAAQLATVGLFVIALLWCAYVARPVIVPVLLAWVIATIVLPLVGFLADRGAPRALAASLVTLLLIIFIACLLLLLSTPIAYWVGRASEVGALIKSRLQNFNEPLELVRELMKSINTIGTGEGTLRIETTSGSVLETIISALTPAVSQTLLFMGALLFYLIYQRRIRTFIIKPVRDRDTRLMVLRRLTEIDESMSVYFGTFTIVNICLGVVAALITWVAGLPNPLLWGVLAAVMNYVPYIGPAIVIGTLAVVGIIAFPSLGDAAVAPLAYLFVVTIEGHFITPTVIGRRLELNPFAVFLAIAFCTWLWGPIGAFLAVPLLIAGTLMLSPTFSDEKPSLPE